MITLMSCFVCLVVYGGLYWVMSRELRDGCKTVLDENVVLMERMDEVLRHDQEVLSTATEVIKDYALFQEKTKVLYQKLLDVQDALKQSEQNAAYWRNSSDSWYKKFVKLLDECKNFSSNTEGLRE